MFLIVRTVGTSQDSNNLERRLGYCAPRRPRRLCRLAMPGADQVLARLGFGW